MIGEPKPTQRQRQLENRITQLELACREASAQLTSLTDQVTMFHHHISRVGPPRERIAAPEVLQ